MTVSPEAIAVPLPLMSVWSMSWLGGWLAGKVTVGLVSKAPVTLTPVFSTTAAPPVDVEPVVGLDPVERDPEPDEQALTETTVAKSTATSIDPPGNRARTKSAINFHSVVRQADVR